MRFIIGDRCSPVSVSYSMTCCLRCRKRRRTLRPLRPTLPASCIRVERLGRVTRRDQSPSANQAFDAKAIREMSLALESVCNALGLHVDDEAARIRVAEKIIKLAGHGVHGATLHATAVRSSKRTAAIVIMAERISYWWAILETRPLPAGLSFGRSTYLCGGGGGEPARAHTLRLASSQVIERWPMPTTQQAHAMRNLARH
jgi:hypothetical protein